MGIAFAEDDRTSSRVDLHGVSLFALAIAISAVGIASAEKITDWSKWRASPRLGDG